MWKWSEAIAERAAAAGWTRPVGEPAPTITDPETWAGRPRQDAAESAGDRPGTTRSCSDLPEYALAG